MSKDKIDGATPTSTIPSVSPQVAANLLSRNWFGDQVAQRFWDELWGEESSASTST